MNMITKFRVLIALVLAVFSGGSLHAQNSVYSSAGSPSMNLGEMMGTGKAMEGTRERSDLTIFNLFTDGWNEDSSKQERATGTPNMALLRVQTNFMEREFRLNYFTQQDINSKTKKNLTDVDALIAWAFNRRLMIEIIGAYQWVDARTGPNSDGGTPTIVGRLQLVDKESSSYSFNWRVIAPNKGLGETQTTFSYGLAGFEDLAYWLNLDRVGFYYSFLFDSLAGPRAAGAKQSDVSYDITLAKTLTSPDTPFLGNFTVFLETFAQTDLSGDKRGATLVTMTPGIRFNLGTPARAKFGRDNWIMFGTDIPVSAPRPWNATYRLTYITNF